MKSKAGFTLIEIMVALVILSLMSAAAVAGLHHMIRVREKQSEHQERYQQMMNAYAVISQDLYYAIRVKPGPSKLSFAIEPDSINFSRTISHGPANVSPAKVSYVWNNQQLKRVTQNRETVLIADLEDIKALVLTKDFIWVEHQNADKSDELPLALKLILSDAAIGEVTWSFTIAQ